MKDPRLPSSKPPPNSFDPPEPPYFNTSSRTAALLAHKGSSEPARDDWRQGDRAASSMPWPPEYERGPMSRLGQDISPRYTEKLPASPRFPSLAQAAQRRRDHWTTITARGSLGLMVGAGGVASWIGTGMAFKAFGVIGGAGLIIFIATCAYAARRNRTRML